MLKDDKPDKLKVDAEETILTTSEDPLIGSLIAERLEILSVIGAGGMSTVYRAKHLLLDRIVAVKIMQVGKVDDNAVRRFQQEAKAATALNHPNIATVREFGTAESGDPYLVMDYIEGISLSDVIKQNGSLSAERTKEIITQVCSGLQHAHSIGVVHRDLKPANVMLSKDSSGNEIAKIVDFGIAKILQSDGQSELTKAGEIFGTPLYMSPEQGLGKTVDARSDIYSTGCMMYECLSGKPPFSAESALETLLQHSTEAPQPLKNGGDLAQVVYRCLEKKPEDRYESAEELSRAILNPTKIRPRAKDTRKKVVFGIACFVIGLLICVATTAWPYMVRKFHPPHWQELQQVAHQNQNLGPGNYDAAKHLYLQAVSEAEKEHATDPEKEQLYKQVGQFCNVAEDWDTSIEYLNKALEINRRHAENGETGSIHDWLCNAYI
ncbi:MAG: serine/threonine protein kinase, partial [Candidatus Melainabacteria bacterium]|nr:serine/threonine protein kinase [Candidatus Melainabacteria bacterium]